jgi:hypothetical protein
MQSKRNFQSRRTLQSSQALATSHKYLRSSASIAGSRNMSSATNSTTASKNRLSIPKSRESSEEKRRPSISMSSMLSSDSPRGGGGSRNSRHNLSLHSVINSQIIIQRAQKKRVNAILRKGKIFRTEEDIGFLANHFKDFKAFVNVSEFLVF